MPGGDRTGPAGMGPMTGRGLGYCAGFFRSGRLAKSHGTAGFWLLAGLTGLGMLCILRKLKN